MNANDPLVPNVPSTEESESKVPKVPVNASEVAINSIANEAETKPETEAEAQAAKHDRTLATQDDARRDAQHDTDHDSDDLDDDGDDAPAVTRERGEPLIAGAPSATRFGDIVSGQFDADEESAEVAPLKRVLLPQADSPKLHKVLAQAGLGSRLEMEQLIMEGRISVNNEPAHIGQRIQFGDSVKVNGKPIRFRIDPPPARVIAYHKPTGEVVTNDDPQNRPTVFRKLPKLVQGKWQAVGRLDLNTEGLLLFTSSGELANKLMHPRFGLEREYAVRVLGALSKEEKQRLLDGVQLDDGMGQFGSIEEGGGEGSNCWYRVTISEGRHREVRRLFEAVGHAVSRLIRIRYGAMLLPRGLKRGGWIELDDRDIQALMQAAGNPTGAARPENRGPRQGADGTDRGPGNGGRGNRNRRRGGQGGQPGGPQGGPRDGQATGQGNGQRDGQRRGPGPRSGAPRPGGGPRGGPPGNGGGSAGGNGGRGRDDRGADRGDRPPAGQPDPMKTAFGYIGADSFTRQRQGPGGGRRGGGMGGGGGGNFPSGGQRRGGGGGGRGR
jgi:23S rRNA pseudouridine2605 synthase